AAGDDTLSLTQALTGVGAITYVLNGGAPVVLRNLQSFTFNGLDGNDSMTVHVPKGASLVSGTIALDGGTGLDTLTIDAAGMPVRTAPGTLTAGVQSIGYANLESLLIDNAAGVNASAGPDTQDRATAFAGLSAAERAVQALYLDAFGRAA